MQWESAVNSGARTMRGKAAVLREECSVECSDDFGNLVTIKTGMYGFNIKRLALSTKSRDYAKQKINGKEICKPDEPKGDI